MRTSPLHSAWKIFTRGCQYQTSLSFTSLREASTRSLDLQAIDTKWQHLWRDSKHWTSLPSSKGPYYVLPMFPYPSGNLHIGHVRVYTISDVIARYRRMSGYKVLHPMGWDAFGLPAENAAIERGVDPAEWTKSNIENMKSQIVGMGGCWDWDKELMTCDPSFYGETQRIFLMLHKRGLAYRAEAEVNYDPIDRTVLANEQVDSNGFSWRSGAKVEKRMLKQWFLRITDYKSQLLEDLAVLEKNGAWPQRVISMQKNWLGRSQGANVTFKLNDEKTADNDTTISVYTTRPDTLFGVQYLALSLDHPLVVRRAREDPELQAFLAAANTSEPDTKAGFLIEGLTALNPVVALSDLASTTETMPVFAAPYVLSGYGTGAVMGVPAHDTRDFAFWKQNSRSSEAIRVIEAEHASSHSHDSIAQAYTELGRLNALCGRFAGMSSRDGGKAIVEALEKQNGQAHFEERWRLRDWLISRQRYWGTPIPIIHCQTCGPVPVPEEQLPVKLPQLGADHLTGAGGNPLDKAIEWVDVKCPSCNAPARRETDTMDTFVDSSWYYLKFAQSASNGDKAGFMPVNVYIGGVEHAILHLLYARFIGKFLAGTDFWPFAASSSVIEPFTTLVSQGMVHGRTLSDPDTGRFLKPDELDLSNPSTPRVKSSGKTADISFEKMSKSKYNGVDPAECLQKFGADVTRAHLLFSAPVSDVLDWDEEKVSGVQRWFGRVWQIVHDLSEMKIATEDLWQNSAAPVAVDEDNDVEAELWKSVQGTIVSTTQAFSTTYTLNTVVSDLMQLTNSISKALGDKQLRKTTNGPLLLHRSTSTLLRLMAPITASFVEECWDVLHHGQTERRAFEAGFPEGDGSLQALLNRAQPCAVQVNGKLKFATKIAAPEEGLSAEELKHWVLRRAFESKEAAEALKKATWSLRDAKKIIVARGGRTVNLVL